MNNILEPHAAGVDKPDAMARDTRPLLREGAGASSTEPVIEISSLVKRFGDDEVLKGVDFEVHQGNVLAILGQSGGGKSTLLRCMNLLETPTSGTVTVGGEQVFGPGGAVKGRQLVALRRRLGMLFQGLNVFPHLSVCENIVLPLVRSQGVPVDEAVEQASALLSKVGLQHKMLDLPRQLSGGQLQRVALARALALNPMALLFDEPTSALDPESTMDVLEVMRALCAEGMTMVIVTHEIRFAMNIADRLIFVDDGKVLESGTPEEVVKSPTHERSKRFFAEHLDSA